MIGTLPITDSPPEPKARDYISYSGISTFQACPLRYYFRYVAGLPEETVSASLVFGGAIHQAVELHFNELLAGNPAPDLDTLLAEYHDAWQEREPASVQFNKGDDISTLSRLAERMLVAFQASQFATPAGTLLGVEEELRGAIIPGCPDLLGRVDLLIETADALHVVDLKTARSRWSQEQVQDSSEQLLLYSELVHDLLPGKQLRLQFAVLTKTKEPILELHDVPILPERIARTRQIVQRVWQAIEAGHFYPAPSPTQCPGCGFRTACRAWRG